MNASTTTFCRPFYHDDILLSKMFLATFSRPFLAADRNGGENDAKKDGKKSWSYFWTPKGCLKDIKKSWSYFGWQKVADEKGRQKVVALAFILSNAIRNTIMHDFRRFAHLVGFMSWWALCASHAFALPPDGVKGLRSPERGSHQWTPGTRVQHGQQ